MTTGLVIGKFYPPHLGHKHLIDTAFSKADHVYIVVCYKDDQIIPGKLRAKWLKEIHPKAKVLLVKDQLADDDSKGWAEFTLKLLGFKPDFVFTSEDYGDAYAKFLGSTHILVDKSRKHVPISATQIRKNPLKYLDFLEPIVRAYFVKRIAIVGAESTGTTTLAKALAENYHTSWVPEYGRFYWEGKIPSKYQDWQTEEFIHIAKSQNNIENEMAGYANKVLICDTNSWATSLWHERYLNDWSKKVAQLSKNHRYDLYILTDDDIPFVQDGTRDGEHIRHQMHQRFIELLKASHQKFIILSGSHQDRLKKAVAAIDALIQPQNELEYPISIRTAGKGMNFI